MTIKEAGVLLDSLLMPFKSKRVAIKANDILSDAERDSLYQVVCDLENGKAGYDITTAIADVSGIMSRYVTKSSGRGTITSQSKPAPMPFLIKQVLFYLTVLGKISNKYSISQDSIIEEIRNHGVSISHNFFSRQYLTPNMYVEMVMYNQPELLTSYQGQKKDELAFAIKHLVYQSGKHSKFIDVFGGSGAASLAVNKRSGVEYVYNELSPLVCNLIGVLCDKDLHKSLIDSLESLQRDIRGKGSWLTNINFSQDMQDFFKRGKDYTKERSQREEEVFYNDSNSELILIDGEIIKYMNYIRGVLQIRPDDIEFKYNDKIYTKQDLLDNVFPDESSTHSVIIGSFMKNRELVSEFVKFANISVDFYVYYGIADDNESMEKITYFEYEKRQKRLRAYKYYALFNNLIESGIANDSNNYNNDDNKVVFAVIQVYRESFTTLRNIGVSGITRYVTDSDSFLDDRPTSNAIDKFCNKDFKKIIEGIYDKLRGTSVLNLDFLKVIQNYKVTSKSDKLPLFYSDSPYVATVGYTSRGSGAFTSQNMYDLILALKDSGGKFIFSCRAAKGSATGSKFNQSYRQIPDGKSLTFRVFENKIQKILGNPKKLSSKEDEEDKKSSYKISLDNCTIYNSVFKVFKNNFTKKSLYVLAIEKGDDLAALIQKNKISEIMITNFEIFSIYDIMNKYKNIKFTVYSFMDFLEIFKDNVNI